MPSHYDTLQVIPNASYTVIKAAYRALAQLYHPDHNPGNAEAEASMKDINLAYQILSNTSSRAQYDSQQRFGDYSIGNSDTAYPPEENFSAAVNPIVDTEMSDLISPGQPYDQPQDFYSDTNAVAPSPNWIMRSLFFSAAVIFSVMVAAKWLLASDPDLAYAAGKNDVPELKLRMDTSPLNVPDSW
jgi:curved DNA-binding protein CbpA